MKTKFYTQKSLLNDLRSLGICDGDGVFLHASMKAVGSVIGGPRTVIAALMATLGFVILSAFIFCCVEDDAFFAHSRSLAPTLARLNAPRPIPSNAPFPFLASSRSI